MVFHTDKGSPGPPGFFYIPVNRKARAQTYGAEMQHEPPPPGLPRKVDGHKKITFVPSFQLRRARFQILRLVLL